jgi:hypothetical protein
VRLTAKQAPHRPGISSALGLRAVGDDIFIVPQTTKESVMKGQMFAAKFASAVMAVLGDL